MKQHYFVVVLAHSLHGRLRRIHVPHQALYVVLALALFGSVSLFGMVSSYLRMSWKVANYNALRDQVTTLRSRYQQLQQEKYREEGTTGVAAVDGQRSERGAGPETHTRRRGRYRQRRAAGAELPGIDRRV